MKHFTLICLLLCTISPLFSIGDLEMGLAVYYVSDQSSHNTVQGYRAHDPVSIVADPCYLCLTNQSLFSQVHSVENAHEGRDTGKVVFLTTMGAFLFVLVMLGIYRATIA